MANSAPRQSHLDYYQRLKLTIILFMLLVACMPLPLVAGTLYSYYHTYVRSTVQENLKGVAEKRREAVEVFLDERVSYLQTLAQLMDPVPTGAQARLEYLWSIVKPHSSSFVDMGIIDAQGHQFAYVGPYDLGGKDYNQANWFQMVTKQGVYISDVFLGYRNVPHLAIAVRGGQPAAPWFLRATIDTETFKRLLQSGQLGALRDAYLLNRERQVQLKVGGREQMDVASLVFPNAGEVRVGQANTQARVKLVTASTWLNHGRWLLVVAEDPDSEFVSLLHARRVALSLLGSSLVIVAMLTFYVSSWLVRKIQAADKEKDLVQEHLAQAGKLMSLGKMAAGLAHEINNPLAVITESSGYAQEILALAAKKGEELPPKLTAEINTVLTDISQEAFRGKDITQRLLGFARKMDAKIAEVDLNRLAADLMRYYARVAAKTGNVRLVEQYDKRLPVIKTDPSQVQQVLVNLVDNAIHFTSRQGGEVCVATELLDDDRVQIVVQDNGPGMKASVVEKIFDPFFTTKPVGQGTGLGLAICYGIVKKLGGEIFVNSQEGQGATFTVQLPFSPPDEEEQS